MTTEPHERLILALAKTPEQIETGLVPCPAHKDDKASLKISRGDSTPVVWHCHAGCAGEEIREALMLKGVLTGTAKENAPRQSSNKKMWMTRIWREAQPLTEGDGAWEYLQSRGLRLIVPPARIRWHPEREWMVSGVSKPGRGKLTGLHCTDLSAGFKRKVRKMHGEVCGGAVELYPITAGRITIAEGIETAIAFRELTGQPTWAVLSAEGIRKFEVPPEVTALQVAVDFDGASITAFEKLQRRLADEGEGGDGVVTTVTIPGWTRNYSLDWLDILQNLEGQLPAH